VKLTGRKLKKKDISVWELGIVHSEREQRKISGKGELASESFLDKPLNVTMKCGWLREETRHIKGVDILAVAQSDERNYATDERGKST